MADFLTHIILAEAVLKRIESRRIFEGVSKKRSLYHLGAQGPDPLFFYKCFPYSGKGPLKTWAVPCTIKEREHSY